MFFFKQLCQFRTYQAGFAAVLGLLTTLTIPSANAASQVFTNKPLSYAYQQQLIRTKQWLPNCPISLSRLRDLQVSYYDFNGKVHHDGHIIVLDIVAPSVIEIFKKLYEVKFPIAQIKPISNFNGDDYLSMEANNTSAFNCRSISGQKALSLHAYGLAIDINTIQNPYRNLDGKKQHTITIAPSEGAYFLDRQDKHPGMVEPIVHIFRDNGFNVWGGDWTNPVDYQHFQTTRFIAEMLAIMSPEDGEKFFNISLAHPTAIQQLSSKSIPQADTLYKENPRLFFKTIEEKIAGKETPPTKSG